MGKKKPELQIGQSIYVEVRDSWVGNNHKGLIPYEVTRINTQSIYAKRNGSTAEQRFDKKMGS